MTNSSNSKAQEIWAHIEEGPQHTNELVFCSRCLQSELITPQTRRAWKWSVTILRPGALFQLGLIHGLESAFFIEQYNQCGCSCAANPMQEIQESPSKIFPFALDWLQSLFVWGRIKKEPAAKFSFLLVKSIYSILSVILPKQILFLNLSLSLGRAGAECWCGMLPGWMGALTGQGNPIPRKKARQWCLPGGRGCFGTSESGGYFHQLQNCQNPTHGTGTPGHLWGHRVTQTQPSPQSLHLLGAALFYFIAALFINTIHDIYIIDISV